MKRCIHCGHRMPPGQHEVSCNPYDLEIHDKVVEVGYWCKDCHDKEAEEI